MNTIKKRIAALATFIISAQCVFSQTYVSDKLHQIVTKTGISIDTSQPMGYYTTGTYDNRALCIGISSDHQVVHVGYKLFADEMRTEYPSDVYNFLERYLLELDCIAKEDILRQYLSDDGVRVVEGSLDNAKLINPSTAFSFTRTDNSCYDIMWTKGTRTLLRLQFPVNFELLTGMRKIELENRIHEVLASESNAYIPSEQIPTVEILSDGYYRSSPLATYQLEELSTASYYERGDCDVLTPVYGDEQPEYSLHNLFRGMVSCNYKLNVKQHLYGYKQKNYTVSLAQWLNYCKAKKLRLYAGVSKEEGKDNSYKVLIIAQNDALAYNHLITVIVPKDYITVQDTTLDTSMNAYIPTHNIKDIYQKAISK